MLAGLLFLDKRTTIDLGLFGRAPICGLIKNASLDRNTNRIHEKRTLEEMEFLKNYQKREVTISIDAKHRNKIIEHCSDAYSY
ncbi:unnamed protein product [Brugia timori]|uniref:Transposase n=1 Tax=Brugia timori TaxID=42155 RepID=A0A0R3QTR8_9BILA|nr:unnamed protein product [Brugia timori]